MQNKKIIILLFLSLLIINACNQPSNETLIEKEFKPAEVDVISETKKSNIIVPEEKTDEIKDEVKQEEITDEIKEFLSIAENKVQSLRYSYKGPQTDDFLYRFLVKGNKIKYTPEPSRSTIETDENDYDTIYIDIELKTAEGYCESRKCKVKGKKINLNYDESYIWTPLDWLDNIESAEKLGEQTIGKRNVWKLSSSNLGTIWVDSFFGVPLQAEYEDNLYRFQEISFNDIKDEEVNPQ